MRNPIPPNLLKNPSFLTGDATGWALGVGWVIGSTTLPNGTGSAAIFTGPGTAQIVNNINIKCAPGGTVAAKCWGKGETGVGGTAVLRIEMYDVNNNLLSITNAPLSIPNNNVWTYLTMHVIAPFNASYAKVDFAVIGDASSGLRWMVTEFFGAYLPGQSIGSQVTYKQPLQYYLNLFTSQYELSPRLNKWQAALMQPIDDLTNCIQTFNISYDIDNAFGTQLDVIGQVIGVSRTLPFQPSGGVSPVLDDDHYRILLYATQAKNMWDGKMVSIYPTWQFLFPGVTLYVTDNQNMTATVVYHGPMDSITADMIAHDMIVPRPETVQYNASTTAVIAFGFDLNNTVIAGFNTGHFV
jgi:Protein of unknown function (DUF2612)